MRPARSLGAGFHLPFPRNRLTYDLNGFPSRVCTNRRRRRLLALLFRLDCDVECLCAPSNTGFRDLGHLGGSEFLRASHSSCQAPTQFRRDGLGKDFSLRNLERQIQGCKVAVGLPCFPNPPRRSDRRKLAHLTLRPRVPQVVPKEALSKVNRSALVGGENPLFQMLIRRATRGFCRFSLT
jgi:hypothetical protein